ncbi:MAG: dTDP-4-dehydrorhamnose 3,5-epimerase [Candidatus Omnitrophica bacterium CG1_02_49_16]|nr:MAG: dTDP-4-dehydrorhamnose 3,5-epimerase [Candidatus Omnitrophica bacterium CG1_02_49_16]
MKFVPTKFPEVVLIKPKVFGDTRGFFYESYREDLFAQNNLRAHFVQDNQSRSKKGVLRALHFQTEPMEQAKLVRVVTGEAFDAVVDIRVRSKTFGQYFHTLLTGENKMMLYVPPGFAHGFLALKDDTEFHYMVSNYYSPEHERGILWNDPSIGIPWPKLDVPYRLSEKDQKSPLLREFFH